MPRTVFIISATIKDWMQRCQEMARDGHSFRVSGLKKDQLAFVQELCSKFKYQCQLSNNGTSAKCGKLEAD